MRIIKNRVSRAHWVKSLEDMMRVWEQSEKSLRGIERMIANAVEAIEEYDKWEGGLVVKSVSDVDEDCDGEGDCEGAISYSKGIERAKQKQIWNDCEMTFSHDEVVSTLPPQHLSPFVESGTKDVALTSSWNAYPKPLYYDKIDSAVEDYVAWKWRK